MRFTGAGVPGCFAPDRVLLDPGTTHSFVSPVFASKSCWQASRMAIPLSVATPLSDFLDSDVFLPNCPVLIKGRELLADLVLLDVMDFGCDPWNELVISALCYS